MQLIKFRPRPRRNIYSYPRLQSQCLGIDPAGTRSSNWRLLLVVKLPDRDLHIGLHFISFSISDGPNERRHFSGTKKKIPGRSATDVGHWTKVRNRLHFDQLIYPLTYPLCNKRFTSVLIWRTSETMRCRMLFSRLAALSDTGPVFWSSIPG